MFLLNVYSDFNIIGELNWRQKQIGGRGARLIRILTRNIIMVMSNFTKKGWGGAKPPPPPDAYELYLNAVYSTCKNAGMYANIR